MKNLYALILFLAVSFTAFGQDGTLDPQFGTAGISTQAIGFFSAECRAMALLPNGKILLAGSALNGGAGNVAVVRLNADGSLDNTFGTAGQVSHVITNGVLVAAMQVHPTNNKIVIGGQNGNDAIILRLNADGSLDNTFGTGGTTIVANGFRQVTEIEILDNNKILASASVKVAPDDFFGVIRLNSNGALDNTFGTNGTVKVSVGNLEVLYRMSVQSDDKILLVGSGIASGVNQDMMLARLNATGSADNTFGTNGVVVATASGSGYEVGYDIAQLPDGKILVAGRLANNGANPNSLLLMRFSAAGVKDATFGTNGATSTIVTGQDTEAKRMALMADGKIVVAGVAKATGTSTRTFIVARYKANGQIDNTFGTNGYTQTSIGDKAFGEQCAIQADGKILVAGYTTTVALSKYTIARYRNTGTSDAPIIEAASIQAVAYPNPVDNQQFTIKYNLEMAHDCGVTITDAQGKIVYEMPSQKMTSGEQVLQIELTKLLPSGPYFAQINTSQGMAVLPILVK